MLGRVAKVVFKSTPSRGAKKAAPAAPLPTTLPTTTAGSTAGATAPSPSVSPQSFASPQQQVVAPQQLTASARAQSSVVIPRDSPLCTILGGEVDLASRVAEYMHLLASRKQKTSAAAPSTSTQGLQSAGGAPSANEKVMMDAAVLHAFETLVLLPAGIDLATFLAIDVKHRRKLMRQCVAPPRQDVTAAMQPTHGRRRTYRTKQVKTIEGQLAAKGQQIARQEKKSSATIDNSATSPGATSTVNAAAAQSSPKGE